MTPDETFAKGLDLKAEGNEHFKKGEYKEALTKYYHAILHLRTVGGNKQKEKFDAESNKQLALIFNNMAAVNIKQKNWKRAMENAKKSLELSPDSIKAKFRLAQSYLHQNELDKAEPLLNEVLASNPDDVLVRQEIVNFKEKAKSLDSKEKQIYQRMLSKMSKD
ncbi:hypothetical protein BCR42DRAFT_407790 [Absidia repens]|uniref:Uncharacterized protein n=1 Tax=Absidia repens TaxID=90262 RepID=A0A1X2ISM6_9FUNG|nr:hypothetical protein BCR42DRAFT_407790 [Absidia repens]